MADTTDNTESNESFIEQSPTEPFPPPGRGLLKGLCTSAMLMCWLVCALVFLRGDVAASSRLLLAAAVGLVVLHVWFPWRRIGRARLSRVAGDLVGRLVEVVLRTPARKQERPAASGAQQPGTVHAGILAIEDRRLRFGGDTCRFAVRARDIAVIRNGERFGPPRSFAFATVTLRRPINGIDTIAIEPHRTSTLPVFWFQRAAVLSDLRPIRRRIQHARALRRREAQA